MPKRLAIGTTLGLFARRIGRNVSRSLSLNARQAVHKACIDTLEERKLLSSYIVATWGTDAGPGTLAQPFRTIQEAANVANYGDSVLIRGGTYHEAVTPAHSGVTFTNYNGESVTVSGADPVGGFYNYGGSVYAANNAPNYGVGNNQVFVDGQMMNEARFPNTSSDLTHQTTLSVGSYSNNTIYDSSITQPAGYWNGALIHITPGLGWVSQTGVVNSSGPGWLNVSLPSGSDTPVAGNSYYLYGKFNALDSAGEYFIDSSNHLYIWDQYGDNPGNHDVEVKTRANAFDLSNVSATTIKGINIFAAGIHTGWSSTNTTIDSFLLLILAGAGALYLPTSTVSRDNITVIDSLFTSTSAACVTGLAVKDIGREFTFMGQFVILVLIQLGGLGIVMFGAVFALLFGQAFSVRESVAMQDLLSTSTLNRIPHLIAFIFTVTIAIEALGAVCLMGLWGKDPSWTGSETQRWFLSFFHSVSAFCNAGFGLFSNNLVSYARHWEVYAVICPLIVLGGLGFAVLYNLGAVVADRIKRAFKWICFRQYRFMREPPKRFSLQAKVALAVSGILILAGTVGILVFERYATASGAGVAGNVPDAFFQSVTARTAGFNTINIGALTESSKFVLILLMFIGGSPGGTAGGVKTVTMAVVVMAVISTLYQRGEIQIFHRSIRQAFVSRSLAVITIYGAVLFVGVLGLTITERRSDTAFLDLMFEATSALGTVGLSAGITASLTTGGKLILIVLMLVGRLGPLSLAAALTFDTRQPRYTYPPEGIVVG